MKIGVVGVLANKTSRCFQTSVAGGGSWESLKMPTVSFLFFFKFFSITVYIHYYFCISFRYITVITVWLTVIPCAVLYIPWLLCNCRSVLLSPFTSFTGPNPLPSSGNHQSVLCTYECVCVCVYKMECHLAIKRNKILPFVTTWVELEDIMLSEISQSEEDKYHIISLRCGI